MLRLGLCCKFEKEPIKFLTTTALAAGKLSPAARGVKLAGLCLANALALERALEYCAANGIGCFRVNSQVLPLATHPELGYDLKDLPGGRAIIADFEDCGALARKLGLRLTFHPDQFILLSSPNPAVTAASVKELDYQAQVAEWIGADVINIHGGGAYGDKAGALARGGRALKKLGRAVRSRLAFRWPRRPRPLPLPARRPGRGGNHRAGPEDLGPRAALPPLQPQSRLAGLRPAAAPRLHRHQRCSGLLARARPDRGSGSQGQGAGH